MKKFIVILFVLALILIGAYNFVGEENITGEVVQGECVELYSFYGLGCPHCGVLSSFLEDLEEKYPNLEVKEYEIYFDKENRKLFEYMADSFGVEIQGVPTIFIDEKVITGFSNAIGENIEEEVQRCSQECCISPIDKVDVGKVTEITGDKSPLKDPEQTKLFAKLTIPAVVLAAAVDAINPCAFAVLIILLATLLAAGKKKKILYAGLAFTSSIFISYYLMGVGLYTAIRAAGLTHLFYFVVAILAIIIGLFNLKDYLWYGKWFVMEVPLSWRPKMKALLRGVTSVPGAFLTGFVVSLFLLPCTSGPYIVILGLLAEATTKFYAMGLLVLYNLIFVLPMLIITLGIFKGFTSVEKAEEWRCRRLKVLHLIAGVIILCLGIGMLIALKLGFV